MSTGKGKVSDRLCNLNDLPTIPAVRTHILKLIEDVNYSVDEISTLIERDQVLSSKVLKLVNSPFYGIQSKIASVRRGVIILGSSLIKGIVLSTSLFEIGDNALPGMWDHSYCTSLVSRMLGRRYHLTMLDELMTGALLHDIGKVLIKRQAPEESRTIEGIVESEAVPMIDAEKKVLSAGHDEVGSWLAKAWNFPPIIQDIIGYHHTPGACETFPKEVAIVHLADIVVKGIGISYGKDPYVTTLDEKGWAQLRLSEGDLTDLVVDTVDTIQADSMLSRYIGGGYSGKEDGM